MDRKSIVILVISFILLVLWFPLVNSFYPPPAQPTNSVEEASQTRETDGVSRSRRAEIPARDEPAKPVESAESKGPERIVTLENDEARYLFTSHGGGLKEIELKGYPAAISCLDKSLAGRSGLASLNDRAPLPVLALLGNESLRGNEEYELRQTRDGLRAEQQLPNGLTITKEYRLGTNYLFFAKVRIENRSDAPVAVSRHEWVIGTATPISPKDDPMMLGTFWSDGTEYPEHITTQWFANRTLGCLPGTPRAEYRAGRDDVAWAAVHNQFFTLAAIPRTEPAPEVVGRRIELPDYSAAELEGHRKASARAEGFQTSLEYPASILQPKQAIEREFDFYAGPKEYNRLARLANQHENNLDQIMDFGKFFGIFSKGLLLSMNWFYNLGLSYGWAIIVITIIIKLLFWPLTNASTKSMKRMAALQPQMKALQEKYKEDPKKMNMKLMEFMKENKVNPMGGCLPMLLQMPVFIGFFFMIRTAIELRGASFLWACDLSSPDTLFVIPGVNFPFNPLPILMGVSMLVQARLTPPAPGMDPVQQKIMRYMPLMFMVFLYNFSSGLTLYWTVQNVLTIIQTKLTKTAEKPAAPGAPGTTGKPGPGKSPAPGPVTPKAAWQSGKKKKK